MKEATNPDAVAFDEAYNPDNDEFDSAHKARAVLVQALHKHPDKLKPLLD